MSRKKIEANFDISRLDKRDIITMSVNDNRRCSEGSVTSPPYDPHAMVRYNSTEPTDSTNLVGASFVPQSFVSLPPSSSPPVPDIQNISEGLSAMYVQVNGLMSETATLRNHVNLLEGELRMTQRRDDATMEDSTDYEPAQVYAHGGDNQGDDLTIQENIVNKDAQERYESMLRRETLYKLAKRSAEKSQRLAKEIRRLDADNSAVIRKLLDGCGTVI